MNGAIQSFWTEKKQKTLCILQNAEGRAKKGQKIGTEKVPLYYSKCGGSYIKGQKIGTEKDPLYFEKCGGSFRIYEANKFYWELRKFSKWTEKCDPPQPSAPSGPSAFKIHPSGLNCFGLNCHRTELYWTEFSGTEFFGTEIASGLNCRWTELSRDWIFLDWIGWDWIASDWTVRTEPDPNLQ